MGSWFNPLTWIKAASLLKSLFDSIMSLYNAYLAKKAEAARQAQILKVHAAIEMIDDANKVEDVSERLKKKALAAKALEDSLAINAR